LRLVGKYTLRETAAAAAFAAENMLGAIDRAF
jgi:hypothetical protein